MRAWKNRTSAPSHWLFRHSGWFACEKLELPVAQLLLSLFSYLLVGAAIFDALESNKEDQLRRQYQQAEESMLRTYNISPNEYIELEDIVIRYQPHKAGAQWKFPGAFYFSLTVITTIGKISFASCRAFRTFFLAGVSRELNSYLSRFLRETKQW